MSADARPKRISTRRIATDDIQGPGSFVVIKSVNYGYAKGMRRLLLEAQKNEDTDEAESIGARMIVEHLVDWNWTDDEGNPLPKPSNDTAILEMLTQQEVKFLGDNLSKTEEDRKKSTIKL